MMELHEIQERVVALVELVQKVLPDMNLVDVPDLIAVNEWKVAIEMLCEHFGDQYDRAVPPMVYAELIGVVKILGVDDIYWRSLRPT
jgi:hypothetical protein